MKKKINTHYPFQVWIKSILLGTLGLFIAFVFYVGTSSFDTFIGVIIVTTFIASVFSWLTFLVCYLVFKRLIDTAMSTKKIKIILCCIAIALMLLTSFFFVGDDVTTTELMIILGSYLAGIIIATCSTRVEKTGKVQHR